MGQSEVIDRKSKYAPDVQKCLFAYKLVNVCSRIALEEVAVW